MKMLNIIVAFFVLASCHQKKAPVKEPISDSSWIIPPCDTVYIPDGRLNDSLVDVIRSKDSALFESNFKLSRVWYYDSLCLKNSKLDKYLKGWVRRALEK